MPVIRCKDCRHWQPDEHPRNASPDLLQPGFGLCPIFDSTYGKPKRPSILAYAFDMEQYEASFVTHREFGCIMGAPKEPEPEPSAAKDTPPAVDPPRPPGNWSAPST